MLNIDGVSLVDMSDWWVWTMEGSGEFSVASIRSLIDKCSLPDVTTKTRWITRVPIKVNIHAWKVKLDCLPTRLNISKRGILIDSILCLTCGNATESSSHSFFDCYIAKEVFRKITRWWDISFIEVSCYEDWLAWLLNLRLHSKHKHLLEGVCYISWWLIWILRNKTIFGLDPPLQSSLFDEVVWVIKASSLGSPEQAKEVQLEILENKIDALEMEFSQSDQNVAFCHNDLQYGNIMIEDETRTITLIVSFFY
ncbi:RNA-directed DNA polymerase, eukaryota [Tanacetum coccineum]